MRNPELNNITELFKHHWQSELQSQQKEFKLNGGAVVQHEQPFASMGLHVNRRYILSQINKSFAGKLRNEQMDQGQVRLTGK